MPVPCAKCDLDSVFLEPDGTALCAGHYIQKYNHELFKQNFPKGISTNLVTRDNREQVKKQRIWG